MNIDKDFTNGRLWKLDVGWEKRLGSKGSVRQDLECACVYAHSGTHVFCMAFVWGSIGDWPQHSTSDLNSSCCLLNYLLKHIFKMSTFSYFTFACLFIYYVCARQHGMMLLWRSEGNFMGVSSLLPPFDFQELSYLASSGSTINCLSTVTLPVYIYNYYETNTSFWTNWRIIFLDKCGLLIKVCFGTEFIILLSLKWVVSLLGNWMHVR